MTGDTRVLWRRAAAHWIDGALPVGLGLGLGAAAGDDAGVFFTLWAGLLIFEFIVLQGTTGWTPGKWVMGIRVVNEEGDPPGIVAAIKRTLPLIIEWTTLFALYAILTHPRAQRFGDRWAHTYVIRAERRAPAFERVEAAA